MIHQGRTPSLGFGITAREALQRGFERGQRFSRELDRPQIWRNCELPNDFSFQILPVQSFGANLIAPDFLKRGWYGLREVTHPPAGIR